MPIPTSGASGNRRILSYQITFATDAHNGVTLYVPTIGEWLMGVWVSVITLWDQAASLDLGLFSTETGGWYGGGGVGAVDVHTAALADVLTTGGFKGMLTGSSTSPVELNPSQSTAATISSHRFLPARFVAATPVLLVVSADGTKGGAAIVGATTGVAQVFLDIATANLQTVGS